MYNDTRVHRVNLSTVLSAQASIFSQAADKADMQAPDTHILLTTANQAFILAYEAAPLDELEAEEPDDPDLLNEEQARQAARAAGGSRLSLYWVLALVCAIVAAIVGLVARKVLLV